MDKILFSERLRALIENKYGSLAAFARVYDAKYNPGTFCNDANSPHKGTINTIKKYVSSKSTTIPSLDKRIEHPKHIYEAMHKQCGLSDEATAKLIYWKNLTNWYCAPLNAILTSANFDHALFHASELMKVTPRFIKLRQLYSEWKIQTFSQPITDHIPHNHSGLQNMLNSVTTKRDIEELHLNESFRYLISELKNISENS